MGLGNVGFDITGKGRRLGIAQEGQPVIAPGEGGRDDSSGTTFRLHQLGTFLPRLHHRRQREPDILALQFLPLSLQGRQFESDQPGHARRRDYHVVVNGQPLFHPHALHPAGALL